MRNNVGLAEAGKRCGAPHKDLREALDLCGGVTVAQPNTQEAGYSRSQIQNLVNTVVPQAGALCWGYSRGGHSNVFPSLWPWGSYAPWALFPPLAASRHCWMESSVPRASPGSVRVDPRGEGVDRIDRPISSRGRRYRTRGRSGGFSNPKESIGDPSPRSCVGTGTVATRSNSME
jgi:hypothetical protein